MENCGGDGVEPFGEAQGENSRHMIALITEFVK